MNSLTKTNPWMMITTAGLLAGALVDVMADDAAEESLPDGRSLVERHIEAIGGREAVLAQTEATVHGKFAMPAAGMSGDLTMASRPPSERVVMIELEGLGEIRSGYRPDLAWSIDPFMGPRLIEGEEFQIQVERMEPAALMRDPEYVESLETVGRTEFDGEPCYRVAVEWRSGRTSHDCYAVDSGLLIAMETTEVSPMGEAETLSLLNDYQSFGDVMMATETRIRTMGQEQLLTISEVNLDPPDEALFELPAPIQTLLEE
jgi:hypothetical protein